MVLAAAVATVTLVDQAFAELAGLPARVEDTAHYAWADWGDWAYDPATKPNATPTNSSCAATGAVCRSTPNVPRTCPPAASDVDVRAATGGIGSW